jgi:hypothetical protein
MGIPTVTITRKGFSGVVRNAFASAGFSAEASQVVYPSDMFLPKSDLSPIREKIDQLVSGLTEWDPEVQEKAVISPSKIVVRGSDYQDALANMNHYFMRQDWGDGLPLLPPTEERVQWLLTGTDLADERIIGPVLPRRGIATTKALAVALAMAGGRPEYMPILIAAVEAMLDPQVKHERMNTTTNSVYPVVIVNGLAANQIRLNAGYGCLGPDPDFPAGASIGRAIRLVLMNLGGALPGETTMSIYGGPARYTGLVFAEDEKGVPSDWQTMSQERGYNREENVVTVYCVSSTTNIPGGETGTKKAALASLNRAAGCMGTPIGNYWFVTYQSNAPAGVLLMARGTAQGLSSLGWSKKEVKKYLWKHAKVPSSEIGPRIEKWWMPPEDILRDPMPITKDPEGIEIAVAGGKQSGHMMWLQVGCCPKGMASAEVHLPGNWNKLIAQAMKDLGAPATEE